MKKTIIVCILSFMLGAGIVALVFLPDRAVDPVPIAETEDERLDRLFRQSLDERNEQSYQYWKEDQSYEFEEVDFIYHCFDIGLQADFIATNYLVKNEIIHNQIEENNKNLQKFKDPILRNLIYEIILDAYDTLEMSYLVTADMVAAGYFATKWEVRCFRAFREDRS